MIKVHEDQDVDFKKKMIIYIIIATVFSAWLLVMVLLSSCINKVRDKMKNVIGKFFWNGAINSLQISYFQSVVACG